MGIINEKDATLTSICADAPGPFELNPDSGEPNANCAFAKLSQEGRTGASAESDDGKDPESLEYLCNLGYNIDKLNKMRPDYLRLVSIVQKCEFKISANLAHNVINKEDKNASDASYIRGKIGECERLHQENIQHIHKPSGYLWKGRLAMS